MSRELSQRQARLVLNGHQFVDMVAQGASVTFSREDLTNIRKTTSGGLVVGNMNTRGGSLTVRLEPFSRTVQWLESIRAQQQTTHNLVRFNGTISEQNGAVYILRNGVMSSTEMGPNYSDSVSGAREYVFTFETITPQTSGARFPAPGPEA